MFRVFNGKKIYLHRFINNTPKGLITDHINRDTLDNRKVNLRVVDKKKNQRNHKIFKTNSSGYTGVSWREKMIKWEAYIWVNNKKVALGLFDNVKKAVEARRLAELNYWHD
jgi:hypothetical protein